MGPGSLAFTSEPQPSSLFRPAKRKAAQEPLHCQISRLAAFKDSLNDIRSKERKLKNASGVTLIKLGELCD